MSMIIRFAFVPVFVAATLAPLARAGDDGGTNLTSRSSSVDINVDDNFYSSNDVTVEQGTTVNWLWVGSNTHTVTSGTPGNHNDIFDSPFQSSGSFSWLSDSVGTFDYHCRVHGALMTGTITVTPVTGTVDEDASVPVRFGLAQNYPNPFNPRTIIRYELPSDADVRLTILNILGQEVAVLVEGREQTGEHEAIWDATGVASGVYFAHLVARRGSPAGRQVDTKKLVLLR